MMAARHMLVAQKKGSFDDPEAIDDAAEMLDYIHPSLVVTTVPIKGRMVRATVSLKAGLLLTKDNPYALAPDVQPGNGDFLTCSRLE